MTFSDPSEPMPQSRVEDEIMRLVSILDGKIAEHATASERSARADVAYKRAHSLALLDVTGRNADEREARAHQRVERQYEERKIAAAIESAIEEACRNIRAQLSALQSLAANQRALVS